MPDIEGIDVVTGEGRFSADAVGSTDAPCVVLLHGFPQTRHTWHRVLPALAESGFRAVAPDQRGYSVGVRPETVDAYRVERLVADDSTSSMPSTYGARTWWGTTGVDRSRG